MSRIMIIDDDSKTLHMLEDMLTLHGYDVTTWSTHLYALEQIELEHPDLLLLDNHLGYPDSGWGILQELRINDATVQLPVIMYSADQKFLAQKEKWIRGMGASILAKPFDMATLITMIGAMLDGASEVTGAAP